MAGTWLTAVRSSWIRFRKWDISLTVRQGPYFKMIMWFALLSLLFSTLGLVLALWLKYGVEFDRPDIYGAIGMILGLGAFLAAPTRGSVKWVALAAAVLSVIAFVPGEPTGVLGVLEEVTTVIGAVAAIVTFVRWVLTRGRAMRGSRSGAVTSTSWVDVQQRLAVTYAVPLAFGALGWAALFVAVVMLTLPFFVRFMA